jgi:hypothetical protein
MTKISKIVTAAATLGVLGVVVLPVASYAADDDVTVNVSVQEYIRLSADKNYTASYGPASDATDTSLVAGTTLTGAYTAAPGTLTVETNKAFTLQVASQGASPNLVSGTNSIPALATHAAGTPGYSIDWATTDGGGLTGTKKAVPGSATPTTILNNVAAPADGDADYAYAFASSIAAATAPGSYSTTVVFTATN